jgi:hypothetical protein
MSGGGIPFSDRLWLANFETYVWAKWFLVFSSPSVVTHVVCSASFSVLRVLLMNFAVQSVCLLVAVG